MPVTRSSYTVHEAELHSHSSCACGPYDDDPAWGTSAKRHDSPRLRASDGQAPWAGVFFFYSAQSNEWTAQEREREMEGGVSEALSVKKMALSAKKKDREALSWC